MIYTLDARDEAADVRCKHRLSPCRSSSVVHGPALSARIRHGSMTEVGTSPHVLMLTHETGPWSRGQGSRCSCVEL